MLLVIIFQIILKLFVLNQFFIFHYFEKNLILCLEDWNDFFMRSKYESYAYKINQHRKIANTYENLPIFAYPVYSISNKNIHIPLIQHKNGVHSFYYRGNNRLGKMQLENDSINMLHVFCDRYTQYMTNERMLYFLQLGIQRILSDKTITFGIGKRYMYNRLHGIGCNTMFNLPIFNHNNRDFPYSMNMGGEYWYRNVVFALNGYYNLNQILYFDQLSRSNHLEYPIMGYQIYIQSVLPYLAECRSHIKLEKFFYRKEKNELFFSSFNDSAHVLSIGIGYKPIPILDFSIDNIFIKKRYVNTLFNIALHYQFNVPIVHQIKPKRYDDNSSLNLNHFSAILKPFLPEIIPVQISNDIHNISKITHSIVGYSKEIKYIKINHNNETSLKWNTVALERSGGKIVHLRDHLYKIYLPKYHARSNNQIFLFYTEHDKSNKISNKHKILIIVEKFQNSTTDTEIYNDSLVEIENTQTSNYLDRITDIFENNQSDQNISILNNLDDNQENVMRLDHDSIHEINEVPENSYSNNDHNNDTSVIPVPPPIPNVLLFLQQSKKSSTSSLFCLDPSVPVKKKDIDQKTNKSSSSNPLELVSHLSDNTYVEENKNDDMKNLFYQLLMQRKTKFSLIGTKEYIEKIEKSIKERKNNRYPTEVGRIFNKLHGSLSESLIDDASWSADDNSDSFSESSKN